MLTKKQAQDTVKDLFEEAVKIAANNEFTVQEFIGQIECSKLSFFYASMKVKEEQKISVPELDLELGL